MKISITMETPMDQTSHRLFREQQDKCCRWPIVYSQSYNISFMYLEKLHPFDSTKWGNIFKYLKEHMELTEDDVIEPLEPNHEELLVFHSEEYLDELKSSINVARITEIAPVAMLCKSLVDRYLLRKLRIQTGGTILAAKLCTERGWAINIGGGFHHCSASQGGGFCAYADISGALKYLHQNQIISKAVIIDLDAHQGNGHERDFLTSDWVSTLDLFNDRIYPHDSYAKKMLRLTAVGLPLRAYEDEGYLKTVEKYLKQMWENTFSQSKPDIIAYNAGTDILAGDPLGGMNISESGIINRDEIVFRFAKDKGIPIFMVTSGGYQRHTAQIIARSIINLKNKGLIMYQSEGSAV